MRNDWHVVNAYGAPVVVNRATHTDPAYWVAWWDRTSPAHAPHRVIESGSAEGPEDSSEPRSILASRLGSSDLFAGQRGGSEDRIDDQRGGSEAREAGSEAGSEAEEAGSDPMIDPASDPRIEPVSEAGSEERAD